MSTTGSPCPFHEVMDFDAADAESSAQRAILSQAASGRQTRAERAASRRDRRAIAVQVEARRHGGPGSYCTTPMKR